MPYEEELCFNKFETMPPICYNQPMEKDKKISTQSYKGVRDFFPEDMSIENAIFSIWRDVCRSYGYEEYGASVLEPAELYQAKSGETSVVHMATKKKSWRLRACRWTGG
jgi:hypothetical protein